MSDKPDVLSESARERTKRASIGDACAFNVMFGFAEQYVVPYAIRLGASNSEIGVLSSVPAFLGSVFQLVGAKLNERLQDRKRIVLAAASLQILTLIPLFLVPLFTHSVLLLTTIFCMYMVFANLGVPSWSSWIGDVVNEDERARYFSRRNKLALTVLFFCVLAAGLILNYFTRVDIWIGYGILFGIAVIGRVVSLMFLLRHEEPRYVSEPPRDREGSFKGFLSSLSKTTFGRFAVFRSFVSFSVTVASPFFAVYMLKDLGFSYLQFSAVVLAPMLVKAITMTYWGAYSERFGNRTIMHISSILIVTIPFWWFIAGYLLEGSRLIFYAVLLAEMVSGFGWAGFELLTFNYMLEATERRTRARSFAYFTVLFGTGVLLGGLAGAWLIRELSAVLSGSTPLLIVFLVSGLLRFSTLSVFLPQVRDTQGRPSRSRIERQRLFAEIVIERPLENVMQQTHATMILAENQINLIHHQARRGMRALSQPIRPMVEPVARMVEEGLDAADGLRETIIPYPVRRYRRELRDELTRAIPRSLTGKKILRRLPKGRRGPRQQ